MAVGYNNTNIGNLLTQADSVVNKAAKLFKDHNIVGNNEGHVNFLKYIVTYGKVPTYDEAKKILGMSGLLESRYNTLVDYSKSALDTVLQDITYTNEDGSTMVLSFENLSKIPQIQKNQQLYDAGYDVSVENFNYVTDANGNVVDRNTVDTTNISTNGYGDRDTYNHIVNAIADDITGLGHDAQQIALVEYYLQHGDLPKDVVDKVIGETRSDNFKGVGNLRYNNLVDKIEEAANEYFTKNPDNLSKDVIDSFKQTFTDNQNATIKSYKDYNFEDAAKIKTSEAVAEAAVESFNVTGTPYSEEIALVKHFMTYGTITREDMIKIMGKNNIGDIRYNTILTKVSNSVAEAMRSQGYMPDATNEQIIESIYKASESARTDKADGKVVNFGHTVTEPTKEENKPLNSTVPPTDETVGTDTDIEGEVISPKDEAMSKFEANPYYTDTWSLAPGTTGYSIYTNLANAERNAAQSAMALADAQYQNAAMQQAATVKNITDQVRAERMARLRAGMNEAQIANQDMQMMMSNINALNDQMNAMNYSTLQAQQQYNLAQDTAYKEYLNQAQAMNQSGAAYYAAQSGDPVTQALEYMKRTGTNDYNAALQAVTTGTTGTTNSTKK